MGSLRLVLALMVLVSHAGFTWAGLNPGVIAVVVFYLISGYVMASLLRSHYATPARAPLFYADRAARIFPQYLLYAVLTLVWQVASARTTMFLTRAPSAADLANNATVIPLNYYMFSDALGYILIPPAWSLGAELQFYLLAPAMVIWPVVGAVLCVLSLAIEALAMVGLVNTDWWGYRLFPGILWIFGTGMALFGFAQSRPRFARAIAWLAPLVAAAAGLLLWWGGKLGAEYNREVLLGFALGVPSIWLLARLRDTAFTRWAGDASYGVFLNHFLLIWLLFPRQPISGAGLALLMACSIALAWATQRLVEAPVLAWRRQLRGARAPVSAAASG